MAGNRNLINNVSSTGHDIEFPINGAGTLVCEITETATVELRAYLVKLDKFVAFDQFTETGVKSKTFTGPTRLQAAVSSYTSGNVSLEVND